MRLTNETLEVIQQLVDNNKDNEALQSALAEMNLALHAYEIRELELKEEVRYLWSEIKKYKAALSTQYSIAQLPIQP